MDRREQIIAAIAKNILGITELEEQGLEEVDLQVVNVGLLREALTAAYDQGRASAFEGAREARRLKKKAA